jgi:hypothetical protein
MVDTEGRRDADGDKRDREPDREAQDEHRAERQLLQLQA